MKLYIGIFIISFLNVFAYDYIPKYTENWYFMKYNINNTREDIKVDDVRKKFNKIKNNNLK